VGLSELKNADAILKVAFIIPKVAQQNKLDVIMKLLNISYLIENPINRMSCLIASFYELIMISILKI